MEETESKVCTKCEIVKTTGDFFTDKEKKDKLTSWCKTCMMKRQKIYKLFYKYGITKDVYDSFYDEQHGCCAICGIHQSDLKQSLSVDHDHRTGRIRGLLCCDCNFGLGRFKDDLDILKKAIMYIANS